MTKEYFQSSFDYKVKTKLYVEDFWATDPCNWTITNYLSKLVAQDPTVSRRNASNRLINDTTIVKNHVVVGTIAETMSSAMLSFNQNSRAKKAFNTFFVSHASQVSQESLKYGVQKTRLKSVMAEQVVNEEEKENDRKRQVESKYEGDSDHNVRTSKRRKITAIDDNQSGKQGDDGDDDDDSSDDQKVGIWEEWKQFLNNQENKKYFMQLSPEMHDVIWCGKLVRRRACIPSELYTKLNQEVSSVIIQDISPCLAEMCMDIFDAVCHNPTLAAEKKLIVDILKVVRLEYILNRYCLFSNDYIYDNCGTDVLRKSESCYRSYLFDSCMKATTKYLRNKNFFPWRN
ncbi:hypothetical protein BY458DRAFT_473877 [Sporodiniella umbellata]|nr:hypothetical protein BY458DRAFT_473877 [Sporodiniella umbellata]